MFRFIIYLIMNIINRRLILRLTTLATRNQFPFSKSIVTDIQILSTSFSAIRANRHSIRPSKIRIKISLKLTNRSRNRSKMIVDNRQNQNTIVWSRIKIKRKPLQIHRIPIFNNRIKEKKLRVTQTCKPMKVQARIALRLVRQVRGSNVFFAGQRRMKA